MLVLTKHIKSVDAEERGIPLPPGEDVERGVAEPDVAHHVARYQQLVQARWHDVRFQVCCGRINKFSQYQITANKTKLSASNYRTME